LISRKKPITRKRLIDWAGVQILRDAEALVSEGLVLRAEFHDPYIKGALLHNNREFETSLRILDDGNVENLCPCYANRERGIICSHVIALALTLVKRQADPEREAKHQEEMRRAARVNAIDDSCFIQRAGEDDAGALAARICLTLANEWEAGFRANAVSLACFAVIRNKHIPIGDVATDRPLRISRKDDALLFVLEDIAEGPVPSVMTLSKRDFLNVLRLHMNREIAVESGPPIAVHDTPMTTHLRMDLDRESGELILDLHTELPFTNPSDKPCYIVAGKEGWSIGADHAWPLGNLLPEPYHMIYENPIVVGRPDVLRFVRQELPLITMHARIETELSEDLFTIDPATPEFRLEIHGSPASLAATLFARYDGLELVANKPDARGSFAIPDPDDIMRYTGRNRPAERRAMELLGAVGMRGEAGDDIESIVGTRDVLNFLGQSLPALRRQGWQVDLHGRIAPHFETLTFATPVVHIADSPDNKWFDVGFDFEDSDGSSISNADIQLALRRGDAFMNAGGRTILIDADAVDSMMKTFSDCASEEADTAGHFRLSSIYAPFVKSSMDGLDGIDVEDSPRWRAKAERSNRTMRVDPVTVAPPLDTILRPYQREGVAWLRFLERNGFCGILADEMGLGKTLQAIAWLRLERAEKEARGKPAMVVCPTSIVENWTEEIARFAPDASVVTLTGSNRHSLWEHVATADIVVTSYALLRRDIEQHQEREFSVVILDEAQHIKNRSTRNAVAAKKIQAVHKLVLTGTPVENGVSDLWSIMDFLMPSYLGRHDTFRANYELPISKGGPDADAAQATLRKKLHPFLLRRLKRDVAKDLPPKIERISSVPLSPDQTAVYRQLLKRSQEKIRDLVASKGFNRCRMEVLTTLLRLRQVSCHLDLLKLPGLAAKQPSSKLDLFLELVDEAIDGNHRILVFSQFVSMLHILRDALKERGIEFCYLDGSTKERMAEVHRFNTDRSVPIFLISLKAGGTGLNLTGADMVIHYDPWWNPAVEAQATDRAYRIGQKRTVYSIKLIAKGTVEEKVVELQKRKQDIIDATIESDEQMMQSMTWNDVQDLLEM